MVVLTREHLPLQSDLVVRTLSSLIHTCVSPTAVTGSHKHDNIPHTLLALSAGGVPLWDWQRGIFLGNIPINNGLLSANTGVISTTGESSYTKTARSLLSSLADLTFNLLACLDQLYLTGLGGIIFRINLRNYSDHATFTLSDERILYSCIKLSPLEDVVFAGAANTTVSLPRWLALPSASTYTFC